MRPSSNRRSTADGAPLRARPGRFPDAGWGRFAPVGAAFRGYLRGQSLCGLWNDPVCLTVFSRRAAPGGSRFAASRTLRPPFSRLTGRVCARMGRSGPRLGSGPSAAQSAGKGPPEGSDARFDANASISSPGLRPGNARPRAAAGKKARSGPLIRVSLTVGRAASRVGPPTLERRFTGSAGLRASRAGGEPARDPEGRAGGPSEPPDRAGAFLCSKERTGYPAPHTHPCRARPAARPPCPRAGTKEPDPAAEGLETGLALRAAARHLTAARNGGCVLLRCPRR